MLYLRIEFFEYNKDDKEYNIFFCPFFRTKIKKIWYFPILYLGELQTTCLCIKFEKKCKIIHTLRYFTVPTQLILSCALSPFIY